MMRRLLPLLTVVLVVACDRSPLSPRAELAPALNVATPDTTTHVLERDGHRLEWNKEGTGHHIRHYYNGEQIADGFIQDKNNAKLTIHHHGVNVFFTLKDSVASVRFTGLGHAKATARGIHTMDDWDGDGLDDITGEPVYQGCCGAEVDRMKFDGRMTVALYVVTISACGAALDFGTWNLWLDAGCLGAFAVYAIQMSAYLTDIEDLKTCLDGHLGCKLSLAQPVPNRAWRRLLAKEELGWMRLG